MAVTSNAHPGKLLDGQEPSQKGGKRKSGGALRSPRARGIYKGAGGVAPLVPSFAKPRTSQELSAGGMLGIRLTREAGPRDDEFSNNRDCHMSTVIIRGWKPGLKKITLTKVIRHHTGFGLAQGKQCTDEVLENKLVIFRNLDRSTAERLLEDIRETGAIRKIKERSVRCWRSRARAGQRG